MQKVIFIITGIFILIIGCKSKITTLNISSQKAIEQTLNQWHRDVAASKYEAYFNKMTATTVFVGTDASEVWTKKEFQDFSKPFFDKKQTWNFKPINRNIYIEKHGRIAWFDELLDTWMGICRGSGVLVKEGNFWKIQHYVLSVTIPNDDMEAIIAIKREKDSIYRNTPH